MSAHCCCVPKCNSKGINTSMHLFPNARNEMKTVFDIWLNRIANEKLFRMDPSEVRKRFRICTLHFSKYSIIPEHHRANNNTILKHRSLPTLNLPGFSEMPTEDNSILDYELLGKGRIELQEIINQEPAHDIPASEPIIPINENVDPVENIRFPISSTLERKINKKENDEYSAIVKEIEDIDSQIARLTSRRKFLLERKQKLKDEEIFKKQLQISTKDWIKDDFSWTQKVDEILKSVFNISEFRANQKACVNATLSKEDTILIMPTGGGKSLCFQLPSLIESGFTLVISPLISLMEDQLLSLNLRNIKAYMLCKSTNKEKNTTIHNAMVDQKSLMRLLYVTPERLAKSKRFMAKLQKAYQANRLKRIAIDEVHCCSQWGHDFRPDYKFLGVLKAMFPDVPLLGLTATASNQVILDVQKMLNIQGCLILKAPFNRPNLYYEVRRKSSVQKDCVAELTELLNTKYRGQSGIIYTTTIKDAEDLTTQIRSLGPRVACYHANQDPDFRSQVHKKWREGTYQAVIATIAFGMGIDKPNVRFVIHHSISKSLEGFYQESGRAGRDNLSADCIIMFRLADVFRLSGMVFSESTGLQKLYSMVSFCLDVNQCRRKILAQHFDSSDTFESTHCDKACDHCRNPREDNYHNISEICRNIYSLLTEAAKMDTPQTANKLMDNWFSKTCTFKPKFSREKAENIIAYLLINNYLKEDFQFTAYQTISYLKRGDKAACLNDVKYKIMMPIQGVAIIKKEFKLKKIGESENLTKKKNFDIINIDSDEEKVPSTKKRKYL